ncbi:polymorphic toxin type 5 domain-containing protein [Mycolicibacterium bacteremicum]|uniref:polymorphic toxin type 5 domain-containing protein n=1 Tax=Mycolicibacterium bacteremicum TaxID=564198 RepID=UPI0013FDC00B|nr:polymorphic toxin type 5 domain-containing protein [Mycolicibacterium bacteremicum]MCV7433723.1 DUF4157 domain-containing protein [Mycolicibacterium bacteremicum]
MPPTVSIASRDDPLEQEADRMANRIAGYLWPSIAESQPPSVASLDRLGPGRQLEQSALSRFENELSTDLTAVRVHHDAAANAAAARANAAAFSVANHIVFAHNEYAPNTSRGTWLLAHELTHIKQHSSLGLRTIMHRAPPSKESARSGFSSHSDAVFDAFDAAALTRWEDAARIVNGLSEADLEFFITTLNDRDLIYWLHVGALKAPGVGRDSRVAVTTQDVYESVKAKQEVPNLSRKNGRRESQTASATTPPIVTKEEQWQYAKDGARNWLLSKAESPLVGAEFGVEFGRRFGLAGVGGAVVAGTAVDMGLGIASSTLRFVYGSRSETADAIEKARATLRDTPAQRALASLRAPEPEQRPTNLREYLRKENYDAMQTTLNAAEFGVTAVAPMVAESCLAVREPSGPVPKIVSPAVEFETTDRNTTVARRPVAPGSDPIGAGASRSTRRVARPKDPYDPAWREYWAQNPEAKRSLSAAAVDDPHVFSGTGQKDLTAIAEGEPKQATGTASVAKNRPPSLSPSVLPQYASRRSFMDAMRRQLLARRAAGKKSLLDYLLDKSGDWKKGSLSTKAGRTIRGRYALSDPDGPIVQAGHMQSDVYAKGVGKREFFMLEDADMNWMTGQTVENVGAYLSKPAVLIDDFPMDIPTARLHETHGLLPAGTVDAAPIIESPDF